MLLLAAAAAALVVVLLVLLLLLRYCSIAWLSGKPVVDPCPPPFSLAPPRGSPTLVSG